MSLRAVSLTPPLFGYPPMARYYPPSPSANNNALLDDQVYVDATGLAPRFAPLTVSITAYWPWVSWGNVDLQWPAGEAMARGTIWVPATRVLAALRDSYGARLSYDTGAGYQHWEIISVHSWYHGGASLEEQCQYIARLYLGVPFVPPVSIPAGAVLLGNGSGGVTYSAGLMSDSAAKLTLGKAGSLAGALRFENLASGAIEIHPPTGALGSPVLTLPAATDVLVARGTVDTLTNKILGSPVLQGGDLSGISPLGLLSLAPPFNLFLAAGSTFSADRMLLFELNDADRGVSLGGDVITGGDLVTVGGDISFTTPSSSILTFPAGTQTLVGRSTVDTLTNKTLTTPVVQGGTATGLTQFGIRSSGTGAFDVVLQNTENLGAQRALTITLNNSDRQVSLGGDLSTAGSFSTSGAYALTLTLTGATNVTLPTSGTLLSTTTAVNQGTGNLTTSEASLAAAGTTQGTAAAVVADNVDVTGGDGTKGVILPAVSGARVVLQNLAVFSVKVYPPTGAKIGAGATNAAYTLGAGAIVLFARVTSTQWRTVTLT